MILRTPKYRCSTRGTHKGPDGALHPLAASGISHFSRWSDRNPLDHIPRDLAIPPVIKQGSEVSSIEDALKACQDYTFDCAIVDYHLPGQDGLAGISALHERLPHMQPVNPLFQKAGTTTKEPFKALDP